MKTTAVMLRIITHAGALLPLALMVWDFFNRKLTANPIQEANHRTGQTAVVLLVLSLACNPLNNLFKFPVLLKQRRTLGLYSFFYAALHLSIFLALDYGLDWNQIWKTTIERPFIPIGGVSFLILLAMAITSSRWWMGKLGKWWKRLHRLVYTASLLVILHFGLARKGSLFELQGDVFQPALYGGILILLLILRIEPIRRRVSGVFRFNRNQSSPSAVRKAHHE